MKTGLVKSLLKTEEQEKITQWLNETEYHWGMIEEPGNYINLMGYDLIFINDSNLSEKSINNLTIFAEMGNKVIINDTIDNQNSLLLEPLGYTDLAGDEVVIKTSKLEIVNSGHPLTKAYKINSIKQNAESIALVNPKLGSGKAVSIVKYKLNDVEEKAPFITVCKLEDGHMIHLNLHHPLNLVFSFLEPDLLSLPDQVFPQVPHIHSIPFFLAFLLPQLGHLFFLAISTSTFTREHASRYPYLCRLVSYVEEVHDE